MGRLGAGRGTVLHMPHCLLLLGAGGGWAGGVSPTLHPSSTAVTQALTSSSLACLAELWEGHAGGQLLRDICHAAGMSKWAKLGMDVLPP